LYGRKTKVLGESATSVFRAEEVPPKHRLLHLPGYTASHPEYQNYIIHHSENLRSHVDIICIFTNSRIWYSRSSFYFGK
jgi:hypothetical protein